MPSFLWPHQCFIKVYTNAFGQEGQPEKFRTTCPQNWTLKKGQTHLYLSLLWVNITSYSDKSKLLSSQQKFVAEWEYHHLEVCFIGCWVLQRHVLG